MSEWFLYCVRSARRRDMLTEGFQWPMELKFCFLCQDAQVCRLTSATIGICQAAVALPGNSVPWLRNSHCPSDSPRHVPLSVADRKKAVVRHCGGGFQQKELRIYMNLYERNK